MITYNVKTVDIMTVRKLKSVSGVVRVEVDIQNLELLGHMESAENRKKVNLKVKIHNHFFCFASIVKSQLNSII